MKQEQEKVIRGLKIEPKGRIPIELSAAICLGCILGFGLIYLIGIISIWITL
jgi:hypothetical protein